MISAQGVAVVLEARGAARDRESWVGRRFVAVCSTAGTELGLDAVALLADLKSIDVQVKEPDVGERRPCRWVPRTARIEHAAARGHVGSGSLYRAFEYAIHINAKQGVDVCDPDVVGLASFEERGARDIRTPVR